ncbi:hypothetical protein CDD82_417 [Ophiocordyceps australis]|uniref:Uncharacterized protein n=1 Tax=Ophiocordyceps australis TaxID=1399860 RepID=A0A2C5YLL3_9HYPO|nr:hypothetical protein CDD82_417 [Ophiocordyceps australis]
MPQSNVVVAPTRINLRRTASYNSHDRSGHPLSATSARFNFNHLLFSPPPSPGLPLLAKPPSRRSSQILNARPSRLLRRLLLLVGLGLLVYLVAPTVGRHAAMPSVLPYFSHNAQFEMVEQDTIPDFPTPIVVSDSRRRPRWTVSIPHHLDFPLSIQDYAGMNSRCREVSAHARDLDHKAPLSNLAHDDSDAYFMDIDEAQDSRLLAAGPSSTGRFVGLDWDSLPAKPLCSSSLTFVLETSDAGLGGSLMMMWILYALAQQQARAFFIDDTRWAYGPYTQIFKAPPSANCRPPPRHHMVPCPAQARHVVVSSVTANKMLPSLLAKHVRAKGLDGTQADVLQLAHAGYQALFKLTPDDQEYVTQRIQELQAKSKPVDAARPAAPIIGVHVRRGDVHPIEYQYRDTYIPAEVFTTRIQHVVDAHYKRDADATPGPAGQRAVTVLASDDPLVHKEPGFTNALAAQQRIRLASKEAVDNEQANPDPHTLHSFREEAQSWEGGFFALMFWNLGADRRSNAPDGPESTQSPPSEQTLRLRSLVARAYVMDLAVLAGASDYVVCAVSATGCRLLGAMLGWERGITMGNWINVDGDYGWSGLM